MAAARRWARHENGFGGGVVGSSDRWDERQACGDCGDDDEPSALAKESGQHDAQSGTDDGPPRKRGDRNGCAVDLETDISSGRDGCHDGGTDGRDCACERTASNKTASARLRGQHSRFVMGGGWRGGHRGAPCSVCAVTSKPSSGPTSCPQRWLGRTRVSAVSGVEWLGREGVEVVANIGSEIEPVVGSFSGSVNGRRGERRQRARSCVASLKCVARLSSIAPQPAIISAKNSFSQSAPLPYALETTRITQLPPDADSIRNSVAIGVTNERSWSVIGCGQRRWPPSRASPRSSATVLRMRIGGSVCSR